MVWVKDSSGRSLRLVDEYRPCVYLRPKSEALLGELARLFEQSPDARRVEVVDRLVGLWRPSRRRLLRVEAFGARSVERLVKTARRSGLVGEVYGDDLPHVQRYLFNGLRIEPSSHVSLKVSGDRIVAAERLPDPDEFRPPPFKLLRVIPRHAGERLTGFVAETGGRAFRLDCSEDSAVKGLVELVSALDPDLIYLPGLNRRASKRLADLLKSGGVGSGLGRCGDPWRLSQGSAAGRVFLGDVFYGFEPDEYGLAGLVERARFSFTTLGLATRWTSNRCIDSRNIYVLSCMDVLAPRLEFMEDVRGLGELLERDRGGITFTPKPGLHENVAALDFDSQYPSIILKYGISYERPLGGGGLIPSVLRPWLERRLRLKRLRRSLTPGSEEELYCTQRIEALKLILCTQYGISGCCWNRFGNTFAFEEINKASRQAMLISKRVAEDEGFEIIYGDVDSLFVKKEGASRREYEVLAGRISEAAGLPMSLDRHFKFLAFPRLRTDPDTPALKRYFGVTYEGAVEARGIELRRSDTPPIIREFQEKLIRTVMSGSSAHEVLTRGVKEGLRLLGEYEQILSKGLEAWELEIYRALGKPPSEYRRELAHVSAALQLQASGQIIGKGEGVGYIYTSRRHPSPSCRVRATQLFAGRCDIEYYREYLRRAAQTVLSALGAELRKADKNARLERWL
ncbi:MAG: DNA polymerase domain-containing protein [Nitrososphaerota archaeon]